MLARMAAWHGLTLQSLVPNGQPVLFTLSSPAAAAAVAVSVAAAFTFAVTVAALIRPYTA